MQRVAVDAQSSSIPAFHQTELKEALTVQEGKLDHMQLDLHALEQADQGKEKLLFLCPSVQSSSGLKLTILIRSGGQTKYHQLPGGAAESPCGPNAAADYRCTTPPAVLMQLQHFHHFINNWSWFSPEPVESTNLQRLAKRLCICCDVV